MSKTLNALLGKKISSVSAHNLVAKGYSLNKLKKMKDSSLKNLGLSDAEIEIINDEARPPISEIVINNLIQKSNSTCSICRVPGKPFIIHHIEDWSVSKSHDEDNLVVLCLDDHYRVHAESGLAIKYTPSRVKKYKNDWLITASAIRANYEKRIANFQHRTTRWYWIHWEHLRARTGKIKFPDFNEKEKIQIFKENGFLSPQGALNPSEDWNEKLEREKLFLFDSGRAQDFSIYVSDVMNLLAENFPIIDINGMLDAPAVLKKYVKEGSLVYFRSLLEIEGNHMTMGTKNDIIKARVDTTGVRIKFNFNAWTSMNNTARGTHVRAEAVRSVVGQINTIDIKHGRVLIGLTPLGISPDFNLHGFANGGWVKGQNNSAYAKAQKEACHY